MAVYRMTLATRLRAALRTPHQWAPLGATLALFAAGLVALPHMTQAQASGTQTFNHTGALQAFTVPAGVTSVTITAVGGRGGTSTDPQGGLPGSGASVEGTFAVSPGETLAVLVGGSGASGIGGGGGGGSFVWRGTSPVTASTLLLTAGGGGGAGCRAAGVDASIGQVGTRSNPPENSPVPGTSPPIGNGGYAAGTGLPGGPGGGWGGDSGSLGAGAGGGGALSGRGGNGGSFLQGGNGGTGTAIGFRGGLGGEATSAVVFSSGGNGAGGSIDNPGTGGFAQGGFGGFGGFGGGGGGAAGGGGGGGYTGGVGGGGSSCGGGGGGGSYNLGANQVNIAGVGAGIGSVTIRYGMGTTPPSPNPTPTPMPTPTPPPPPDTTPPALNLPAEITVDATSPAGATVSFTATATDSSPASPAVTCTPPSGSTFPVGQTTVNCNATDAAGNTARGSFIVRVRGAADQLQQIQVAVAAQGPGSGLDSKVGEALAAAQAGDTATACGSLQALINQARAQSGKQITEAQATTLIADATRIRATLGCR